MKKVIVLMSILVLALASLRLAQPKGDGFGGDCKFGGGMHQGCGMHDGGGFGWGGGDKPGHGPMQRHAFGINKVLQHADDLKLTDQQVEKLEGMVSQFQVERIDQEATLEKAHVELQDLMRRDAPENEIMAAIDKVSKSRADMQKMHYRHFQAAKAVLTPEQIDQLKALRRDKGERRFEMRDDKDRSGPGGRRG